MNDLTMYPNERGGFLERDNIRVELYHDGTWAVYTLKPDPFRCIASADRGKADDIEGARILAREAFKEVRKLRQQP